MRLVALFSFIFIFSGCAHKQRSSENAMSVYLMTFNVENLFDTKDAPDKNDETFLPASQKKSAAHKKKCNAIKQNHWRKQCLEWDWNEDILHTKMLRLSQTLRQANGGRGPDLVFLQEVENIEVLKAWNDKYLADLGYTEVILIEGRDARGIDVAMLSRLPQAEVPQLHFVPYQGADDKKVADTRGLLEAHFTLPDGSRLVAFSVHFPAPFHPAEMRIQTFNALNERIKQFSRDQFIVVAGDFNVPTEEDQKLGILETKVKPHWIIAHQAYCQNCKGTTYYPPKKSWSFLDMILLSKTLDKSENSWQVDPDSFAILNEAPDQKTYDGYPASFELPEGKGVSDHWPLGIRLIRK